MTKKTFSEPPSSEITPEGLYLNRRAFLKAAGLIGVGGLLAACVPALSTPAVTGATSTPSSGPTKTPLPGHDELGDPENSFQDITNSNIYYEFSEIKEEVAALSANFPSSPWKVEVSGLVQKPMTLAMEDILKKYPQEERIYRLRCVEAWSMVIPWTGFPAR